MQIPIELTPGANSKMPTCGRAGFVRMAMAAAVVLTAIWLPSGFSMGGLIEEWDVLGLFNTYGRFFVTGPSSHLPVHALRPLTIFPHALANWIDPDSFSIWHVILLIGLFVKAAAMAHLTYKVTRSPRMAALAGTLLLLYPADTMQLSFRSLHINWALAIVLAASSLSIQAMDATRRSHRHLLGVAAALGLFAACCMYEATLPLVALPPLVLYARGGLRHAMISMQSKWGVVAWWLSGLLAYVGYAVWASAHVTSYQGVILGDRSFIAVLLDALPQLFTVGAVRSLLGGWVDAFKMVGTQFHDFGYLLAASLLITIVVVIERRGRSVTDQAMPAWLPLRIVAVGIALALLGYMPFLVSKAHIAISQRTYLFSSPGAVLVWVSVALVIARWLRPALPMLVFILVLAGLGQQLVQFHHYLGISRTQKTLLRSIVESIPQQDIGKPILILDGSDQLGQTWMFTPETLRLALTYVYGKPVAPIQICRMPEGEWERPDSLGRKGNCRRDAAGWALSPPDDVTGPGYTPEPRGPQVLLADATTTVVQIAQDGSAVHPSLPWNASLASGLTTASRRYLGALAPPITRIRLFKDEFPRTTYRGDFGTWWSLEIPIRGTGWREPGWSMAAFRHESSAWKSTDRATLYFELTPAPGEYRLRGRFNTFVNDSVKSALIVQLNGVPVFVGWGADGKFEGVVPAQVLKPGTNELAIVSPSNPAFFGLSANMVKFELRPRRTRAQADYQESPVHRAIREVVRPSHPSRPTFLPWRWRSGTAAWRVPVVAPWQESTPRSRAW